MRRTTVTRSILLLLLLALTLIANVRAEIPENAVWIDVRSPAEFAGGHLDGAVNIPFDAIEKGVAGLKLSTETPIYLYCAVGGRAEKARQSLLTAGYSTVVNVGGLQDARKLAP